VKERPILMSAPMVRAILDGRKTQTRRVAKFTQIMDGPFKGYLSFKGIAYNPDTKLPSMRRLLASVCPHGQLGDRLWVRETWAKAGEVGDEVEYRADNHDPLGAKWRPSIFMTRNKSRIDLEVTGVRVERLQDISLDDCEAEGIEFPPGARSVGNFAALWDSINGEGAWKSNPWVWCIEFKRVRP
jgi:hypothetical protein